MQVLGRESSLKLLDKIMSFFPLSGNSKIYHFLKVYLYSGIYFVGDAAPSPEKFIVVTKGYKEFYIRLDEVIKSVYHYFDTDLLWDVLNESNSQTKQVHETLAEIITQVVVFYESYHNPKNVFNIARHELSQFYQNELKAGGCDEDVLSTLEKKLSYDSQDNGKLINSLMCPAYKNLKISKSEYVHLMSNVYTKTFGESLFSPKTIFDITRIVFFNDEQWHWLVSGICVFQKYDPIKNAIFNIL